MKPKIRQLSVTYLFTLLVGHSAMATEFSVTTNLEIKEAVGNQVMGNVTADVLNMSGSTIRNVDLRLANPGGMTVEKGVLQFGRIPSDDVKTTTKLFNADQEFVDSGEPVIWRLDYDDANGNHQQEIISSDLVQ